MLNINDGNNEELKESCKVLREYMEYVNRVRKYTYREDATLSEAVERAVTECIEEGILEEFLRKNRAEVVAMSIFEFDEEREWKLIRETEYQYGVEDGIKQGVEQGIRQSIEKLLKKRYTVAKIADILDLEEDYVKRVAEECLNIPV